MLPLAWRCPAGVDDDLGVADAVRAVAGVEGGAAGLERARRCRRRSARRSSSRGGGVLAEVTVSPEAKFSVPLSASVVYVLAAVASAIVHRARSGLPPPLEKLAPWLIVKLPGKT